MLTLFSAEMLHEIMTAYTDSLKTALGDNLIAVVLFGSCARGDYELYSDTDVFILVHEETEEVREAVLKASVKYNWDYEMGIVGFEYTIEHYNRYYYETLFQNIRKEGKVYYGTLS